MTLDEAHTLGLLVFEDHMIARSSFMLPANCHKASTKAWLLFLEQAGWIESAAAVEHATVLQGRAYPRVRFPPD